MAKGKFYAVLQESCSNGYRYEVYGKSLIDVRGSAIMKFINSRWHKTADPPMIRVYEDDGSVHGRFVGEMRVSKQYYSSVTPYLFFWRVKNGERVLKRNGELGATYEGYKKLSYPELYKEDYPYWRD